MLQLHHASHHAQLSYTHTGIIISRWYLAGSGDVGNTLEFGEAPRQC